MKTKKHSVALAPTPRKKRELEKRRNAVWLTYRWRRQSLRHLHEFATMLRNDHDGNARAWVQDAIAEDPHERAEQIPDIVRLRVSIEGVSPVLLAACEHEELPIGALAYALVPFAYWPKASDGWPWTRDQAEYEEEPDPASSIMSSLERSDAIRAFVHRNRDDGTFMRAFEDRRGGWAASVRRGVLGTEVSRGGFKLRTVGDRGTLTVPAELPESAASAVRGRPVSDVVDHPALRNPCLVMTSARVGVGSTTIRFRCPPLAADFGALTREPTPFQYACDVALQREHALLILLAHELGSDDTGVSPAVVHGRLLDRVRDQMLVQQRGALPLEAPTVAWVEDMMRPERRELLHSVVRVR